MTALNQSPPPLGEDQGKGSNRPASILLTENLPMLAGAPNGIKKLRELILELAVRGKLVAQDPSDEPASELLKRIAAEKVQLVSEGTLKKLKLFSELGDEDKSFEIPNGWSWAKLGELVDIVYGKGLSTSELTSEGYEVFGANGVIGYYSSYLYAEPQLLVSCRGAYSGKPNISPDYCFVTSNSLVLQSSWKNLSLKFFFYALSIAKKEKIVTGSAQPQVTTTNLDPFPVIVPPLAEQHRIVTKVDELMALCDRLEAQQANAESNHAQLVHALLDSLTQSSDATDFTTNWQRLAEHFQCLFTTEFSIDALKQTLLQLAVMGKLVPQDPSDEPASELLRRVWEANKRLDHELSKKSNSEEAGGWIGNTVPESWAICRVSNIAEVKLGSTPSRAEPSYWEGDIPWVSSGEVANSAIKSTRERITQLGYKNSSTSMVPAGSVLIAMIGQGKTRGQSALLEINACTNQNVAALVFNTDLVASRYIWLWAQSMYSLHRAEGHGGAQPALNAKKVKAFSFPLPPTAEQHRIVAKVDQLMTLCDQLKNGLTQARQLNEQLASTLVEQAVA